MYAVVGCSECEMLWVVEGRPETSQCPRCGARKQYAKRKKFVSTEDENQAREARAKLLAKRQGHEDAFDELPTFAELDESVDDVGLSDETYLEGSGIDPDAVAAAGERISSGGESLSREERVREGLRTLDDPTDDDVVDYAGEHGVSEVYVRRALEKLVRAGEVTENRGVYRLVD